MPIPDWRYHRGTWEETSLLDAPDEEWEETLERLGFRESFTVGILEESFGVRVMVRDATPRFLLDFTLGYACEHVFADDFPDFLDLISRYAPAVSAAELSAIFDDIRAGTEYGLMANVLASLELSRGQAARNARTIREERSAQYRKMAGGSGAGRREPG